ncbi:NADPH oxidase 4 isoform X1, partial [Lates japonicus]
MVVSLRSWVANEEKHLVLVGKNVLSKILSLFNCLQTCCGLGSQHLAVLKTFLLYSLDMVPLPLQDAWAQSGHQQGICFCAEPELQRIAVAYVSSCSTFSEEHHNLSCGLWVAICIFSVVHVSAHLVNVVNFSVSYSDEFPALNLARYRGEDPKLIILTTIPGITGVLLVLILFLMFTSSSYCVRVSNYEIFWYTHNLFIVFYIILMVHMVG